MRRKDLEITDREQIISIIEKATVCRLGMIDGELPYIVPVNFGYKDDVIYIHSAPEGKKVDILKKNSNICFEMDIEHELKEGKRPCAWGMKYQSVIGYGKAIEITDLEEKTKALNIIHNHYSSQSGFEFRERMLNRLFIIKIEITQLTGKKSV